MHACHVSHVSCHMPHVTCHMSQSGEDSRWRVCYQRGLTRLVFTASAHWAVRRNVRLLLCVVRCCAIGCSCSTGFNHFNSFQPFTTISVVLTIFHPFQLLFCVARCCAIRCSFNTIFNFFQLFSSNVQPF